MEFYGAFTPLECPINLYHGEGKDVGDILAHPLLVPRPENSSVKAGGIRRLSHVQPHGLHDCPIHRSFEKRHSAHRTKLVRESTQDGFVKGMAARKNPGIGKLFVRDGALHANRPVKTFAQMYRKLKTSEIIHGLVSGTYVGARITYVGPLRSGPGKHSFQLTVIRVSRDGKKTARRHLTVRGKDGQTVHEKRLELLHVKEGFIRSSH